MLVKKITLAALAGPVLLAAAPAFADQGRHDFRGERFEHRALYVQQRPYYAPRPVFVHRAYQVQRPYGVRRPAVVVRDSRADVLGGLIVGAVLGAVIANHAGY